jgi:DNA-binding MarR family transcriptional regulator
MDDNKLETIVENITGMIRLFHLAKSDAHENGIKFLPFDPHHWTLLYLQKQNLTMSDLGKKLLRSRPNMTAIIDKLITEGFVKRLPDEKDRRITWITLTDEGRKFIKGKKLEVKEALKQNLASLSSDDLNELGNLLEQTNRLIIKIGERKNE